jgi:ATP-dependent Clp protease adaptor protein ClpS
MVKEKKAPESEILGTISNNYELILFNDNVNEFTFVIETLIQICGLEPIQAEQITLIVHEKGKCGVISGSVEELRPMYEKLSNNGLTVTIE